MSCLGNLIWIIFGGLFSAIAFFLLGILWCITLIGIPFGLQAFKMAKLVLAPFGKKVDLNFSAHPIANVIWAVFGGFGVAFMQLISSLVCCATIVGIPFGLQGFKIAKLSLFPFGAKVK